MVVEGQFAGATPDRHAQNEAGAQGGKRVAEDLPGVRPVEAVDAEARTLVHAGADVDAGALLASVEPADHLEASHLRPPGGGTVNVVAGRVVFAH